MFLGLTSLAGAVVQELVWLRRRNWNFIKGEVTGSVEDSSGDSTTYSPEIEIQLHGQKSRFVSDYGRGLRLLEGTTVDVIVSAGGTEKEHYTWVNRFLATFILLLFGLIFAAVGWSLRPGSLPKRPPLHIKVATPQGLEP